MGIHNNKITNITVRKLPITSIYVAFSFIGVIEINAAQKICTIAMYIKVILNKSVLCKKRLLSYASET